MEIKIELSERMGTAEGKRNALRINGKSKEKGHRNRRFVAANKNRLFKDAFTGEEEAKEKSQILNDWFVLVYATTKAESKMAHVSFGLDRSPYVVPTRQQQKKTITKTEVHNSGSQKKNTTHKELCFSYELAKTVQTVDAVVFFSV